MTHPIRPAAAAIALMLGAAAAPAPASITQALQILQLDTGYYTTLENLDDVTNPDPFRDFDYINDNGGALIIDPNLGEFATPDSRIDVLNPPLGYGVWQGPYITYQSGRTEGPNGNYDEGSPLDPWGQPYYFYTPLGLVEPKTETISQRFYGDEFNDYRVVSHGPDLVMGGGDDILGFVAFHQITQFVISSVRISPASSGNKGANYDLTVRGYNFGPTAGEVLLNGSPLTVQNWTAQEVTASLTGLPAQGSTFTIRRPDTSEAEWTQDYIVEMPAAAVGDWMVY